MIIDDETKRREAHRLAAKEVTAKELAKKYDISESTARGWRKRYVNEEDDALVGGNEVHRLRKEITVLKGQVQSLLKTVSQLALNQK